jgi:hypothetical protein
VAGRPRVQTWQSNDKRSLRSCLTAFASNLSPLPISDLFNSHLVSPTFLFPQNPDTHNLFNDESPHHCQSRRRGPPGRSQRPNDIRARCPTSSFGSGAAQRLRHASCRVSSQIGSHIPQARALMALDSALPAQYAQHSFPDTWSYGESG